MALEELMTDQDQHCKKTCRLKEFHVSREGLSDFWENSLTVLVNFKLPEATRGIVSKSPFKTVKTEQYILSGLALLGNIGGILGIFVGFSFLGITESLISISETIGKRLRKSAKRKSHDSV